MRNNHKNIKEITIDENHRLLITVVMGKLRNQARKLAQKNITNEILEEIREKKRNGMTNRRLSMDTQPILVVEDAIVLPTNP